MRLGRWKRFPRRIRYRRKSKGNYSKLLLFGAICLLTFYIATMFNTKIKPTIISIAETKVKYIATNAINEAVNEKVAENNMSYEDLVVLQKNNEGQIIAVQANIIKMNQLKSALSISTLQKIAQINSAQVNIPIGNVISSDILSGWGPRIPIKLIPVGSVKIDFKNNFTTAGINQTKHEIYLEIQVKIAILLPASKVNSEVITSVPVAETIIVGTVPQTYTNVEGASGAPPDTVLETLQ